MIYKLHSKKIIDFVKGIIGKGILIGQCGKFIRIPKYNLSNMNEIINKLTELNIEFKINFRNITIPVNSIRLHLGLEITSCKKRVGISKNKLRYLSPIGHLIHRKYFVECFVTKENSYIKEIVDSLKKYSYAVNKPIVVFKGEEYIENSIVIVCENKYCTTEYYWLHTRAKSYRNSVIYILPEPNHAISNSCSKEMR